MALTTLTSHSKEKLMDQPAYRVGDFVMVAGMYARPRDRGVIYRVTKVMPVNIVAEPVHGGRPIKGKPDLFVPAPADAHTSATVSTIAYQAPLSCGEVVTVAGPGWRQPAEQLYVVLRESPDGKVKLARLGGEGGRYWPSIPRSMVTVVDPTRITLSTPPA
jgi:hypothetical protein